MDDANQNWRDCAEELGLELCELEPLEALRLALLDMNGLDPGQEDRLPPEEQSKLSSLQRVLALLEKLGALSRLGETAWKTTMVRGDYKGNHVSVHSLRIQQEAHTGVSLRFARPLGVGLRIVREGMGHKLGKLLRLTQDLQLDDPVLDPLVLIQAEDVEGARVWLQDEGLREELRDLFQLTEGIEVLDWGLRFQGGQGELTPARVRALLEAMLPIAYHVR